MVDRPGGTDPVCEVIADLVGWRRQGGGEGTSIRHFELREAKKGLAMIIEGEGYVRGRFSEAKHGRAPGAHQERVGPDHRAPGAVRWQAAGASREIRIPMPEGTRKGIPSVLLKRWKEERIRNCRVTPSGC